MGCESGAAIRNSGLEYVGSISRYWGTARSVAGHGNLFRDQGSARREEEKG